jgi:hypothetical protein
VLVSKKEPEHRLAAERCYVQLQGAYAMTSRKARAASKEIGTS